MTSQNISGTSIRPTITTVPLKTPIADGGFISTVTNYQSNYGVPLDRHRQSSGPPGPYNYSHSISGTTPALGNILQVYCDFVYFLLVCPFRIGTDDRGKFVIKKHRLQMVLCAIMHLMCFIRLMTEVRVSIDKEYSCKNASKNPVQYFNIIMDASSFIYKMVIIKRFWFNQMDYLNVLVYVQGKTHLDVQSQTMRLLQSVSFLRIFLCLATIHAFTSFIVGKNFIHQSNSWSFYLWRNQLVKLAKFTFYFDKSFSITDVNPLNTITNADVSVTIFMSISLMARFIIGIFCDLFLLFHTLTLWIAARSFAITVIQDTKNCMKRESEVNSNQVTKPVVTFGVIEGDGELTWSDVYAHFRLVQKLAMIINIALGNLITWYMTEAVMYYSVRLNNFLTSSDVFVRVDLAVFYFTTIGILFVSADICSQMERVKDWISFGDNRKTVPADEFSIVLHEMLVKDIGIRGSNVFTITYSLLAVFFSTIVTYFIICVQQGDASVSAAGGGNYTKC